MKCYSFRFNRILVICITTIFISFFSVSMAQENKGPGAEPYSPTKIEWAAIELQGYHGTNNWSDDSAIFIRSWIPIDSSTIICIIVYNKEVPESYLEQEKKRLIKIFNTYKETRGWDWMKLEFKMKAE